MRQTVSAIDGLFGPIFAIAAPFPNWRRGPTDAANWANALRRRNPSFLSASVSQFEPAGHFRLEYCSKTRKSFRPLQLFFND
ncbi:hypothetical protein I2I05_00155 [Hymenobacter sp. BT683]|uniref:Uncharacterized protein n=1 Tax=Hymenobacter jeongseonensis TaxID=2791027 RepID=A0ABS0IBV0_9BACT|nr:hypothetical protein [Hymenobacter jeongseonensis]MBF9235795.1 hypothetical protein [Hymenobacter jeongseonensis]